MVLYAPSCPIENADNNKKDLIVRMFASSDKQGLGWLSSQHAETVGKPFVSALELVIMSCSGRSPISGLLV